MPSSLFADSGVQGDVLQTALNQLSLLVLDNDEEPGHDGQEVRGRSVNMTQCVPVPSSEHVAEIVGRQGVCFSLPLYVSDMFSSGTSQVGARPDVCSCGTTASFNQSTRRRRCRFHAVLLEYSPVGAATLKLTKKVTN